MKLRHQSWLVLGAWALVCLFFLHRVPYDLSEAGAKAILLDWSIGDAVANSVVTLGIPDLRTLLWIPLGFLWSGQILAPKIITLLLMVLGAHLLYAWRAEGEQNESALLATGLLLIAPLTLDQVDSLGVGPYLLVGFILGHWLDQNYRQDPRPLGGWYFAQLGLSAFLVSLHLAGLAYPLALFMAWRKNPLNPTHQRFFMVGVPLTTLLGLAILLIRHGQAWGGNPILALLSIFGVDNTTPMEILDWILGLSLLFAGLLILWRLRLSMMQSLMGSTLALGALLGLFMADGNWALIWLALLLFEGFPWLLQRRAGLLQHGFLLQRGWAWALVFVLATSFMVADRAHLNAVRNQVLSSQDQLIRSFADQVDDWRHEAEAKGGQLSPIRVASQWPARTMVACRCDALPLPPAAANPEAQLAMMKGLSHLLLMPNEPANLALVSNLSQLGPKLETLSLQPGGVILQLPRAQ
jgi:hypothetical protein